MIPFGTEELLLRPASNSTFYFPPHLSSILARQLFGRETLDSKKDATFVFGEHLLTRLAGILSAG